MASIEEIAAAARSLIGAVPPRSLPAYTPVPANINNALRSVGVTGNASPAPGGTYQIDNKAAFRSGSKDTLMATQNTIDRRVQEALAGLGAGGATSGYGGGGGYSYGGGGGGVGAAQAAQEALLQQMYEMQKQHITSQLEEQLAALRDPVSNRLADAQKYLGTAEQAIEDRMAEYLATNQARQERYSQGMEGLDGGNPLGMFMSSFLGDSDRLYRMMADGYKAEANNTLLGQQRSLLEQLTKQEGDLQRSAADALFQLELEMLSNKLAMAGAGGGGGGGGYRGGGGGGSRGGSGGGDVDFLGLTQRAQDDLLGGGFDARNLDQYTQNMFLGAGQDTSRLGQLLARQASNIESGSRLLSRIVKGARVAGVKVKSPNMSKAVNTTQRRVQEFISELNRLQDSRTAATRGQLGVR